MKIKKFNKTFEIVWWQNEFIGKKLTLDTETELIRGPGHIPRLVISTAYAGNDKIYLLKNNQVKNFLEMHKDSTIAFHSAKFDLKVLNKSSGFDFHSALMNQKIKDTAILYRLLYLATKGIEAFKYSLDHCIKEMYNEILPKDDAIRLTFGQYIDDDGSVRYDEISKAHIEYAALDPVATWLVWQKINEKMIEVPTSNECAHYLHLLGDVALDKIDNYGISIDLPYVNSLRSTWEAQIEANAKVLSTYGLVRGQKGFKKVYADIIDYLEIDLPRTGKTQKVSMKKEHLEPYSREPFVKALLEFLELEKLNNFLNKLTTERVYPRYSSIKKTGRTSCSEPNIQNPPRIGGVRESFIPKSGHVFIDIDYSSIELYALAQILKNLYGRSVLFDQLEKDKDVHIYAASHIFNIDENILIEACKNDEPEAKKQRQIAKICNYGLAANMSAETFMGHMNTNGVDIDLEGTIRVKKAWSNAFPEIKKFWKRAYGRNQFISRTGFVRNNCSYTQYLNIHFQSLVAEGCKIMLYMVQKEGYNVAAFIHDQILVEHPIETAEEAMPKVQKIMEECMQKLIPELKIKTEGKLINKFQK